LPCNFYLLSIYLSSIFFFSSPNLSGRMLDVGCLGTWCDPSANLECRSEMCGSLQIRDAKKSPKIAIGTIAQLCRAISPQLRHVSTIGKKFVKQQYLLYVAHNMVNFGPLAVEIVSLVWGTPANFNRFRVLAALLHGTLVVGVSQTAAFNRGCHLYSAGRPSRWASAHIFSFFIPHPCQLFYSHDVRQPLQSVCYSDITFFIVRPRTNNKIRVLYVFYDQ